MVYTPSTASGAGCILQDTFLIMKSFLRNKPPARVPGTFNWTNKVLRLGMGTLVPRRRAYFDAALSKEATCSQTMAGDIIPRSLSREIIKRFRHSSASSMKSQSPPRRTHSSVHSYPTPTDLGMATYVYDKLDPTRKQIRICIIHPGAFEDPIRCSLRTVSLDDNPHYETLSYAWGAPVLDHTVLVDGAALKVTKNLHNALQYLRPQQRLPQQRPFSKDEYESGAGNTFKTDVTASWRDSEACKVLWADAVCINQADMDERASQVNLMGDVYRRGIRLHVWIGTTEEIRDKIRRNFSIGTQQDRDLATREGLAELRTFLLDAGITTNPTPLASAKSSDADADVKGAMEILQLFHKNEHCYTLPFFKASSANLELERDEFWYKSIAMLLGILNQPWWKRVWVVQEVLLSTPTEDPLLHISHHRFPLSSCDIFSAYFSQHFIGCCRHWYPIFWGTYELGGSVIDAWHSMFTLENVLRVYKDGAFDIGMAYEVFPPREAAEPHDYIYGFLSLIEDFRSELEADYRRPISSLYIAATKAAFRAYGGIELLKVAVGVGADNQHHLPSWCIDWSEEDTSVYSTGLFNAAQNLSPPLQDRCEDEKILLIEATAEDRITCVSPVIEKTTIDPVDHVVRWMRVIGRRDIEDDIPTVLKVLAGDRYTDLGKAAHQRISPQYMELLEEWKDFISSNKRRPECTGAQKRLWEVDFGLRKRQCLFLTRHGRLGAGPPTTREGDRVFVAKGSPYPLALRPLSDSSFEDGQQVSPDYQFVSLCYVDGIMDGEAVDADTEWQTIRLC